VQEKTLHIHRLLQRGVVTLNSEVVGLPSGKVKCPVGNLSYPTFYVCTSELDTPIHGKILVSLFSAILNDKAYQYNTNLPDN
jgi:hypothetical protein